MDDGNQCHCWHSGPFCMANMVHHSLYASNVSTVVDNNCTVRVMNVEHTEVSFTMECICHTIVAKRWSWPTHMHSLSVEQTFGASGAVIVIGASTSNTTRWCTNGAISKLSRATTIHCNYTNYFEESHDYMMWSYHQILRCSWCHQMRFQLVWLDHVGIFGCQDCNWGIVHSRRCWCISVQRGILPSKLHHSLYRPHLDLISHCHNCGITFVPRD